MKKLIRHRDILFSTLSEITSLIVAGHDKRMIFRKVLECSIHVLDAERVFLLELDGNRLVRYSRGIDDGSREPKIDVLDETPGVLGWMIKETEQDVFQPGRALGLDVPTLTRSLGDDTGNRVIISAPLVAKTSMFGLLIAIHRSGALYAPEDVRLLTLLANQAAIAVENALLYQKLEQEAITDGLTSVYNYRFLISSLESEIKRARRFKQSFSFVMLDVDNLKSYNDRHGHLSGSQVLKEIATIIKASCREIDFVSKYGGDEFGVLLPQTRLAGAEKVTRRVVDCVREHCFDAQTPGLITCSAGVSSFPRDGQTPQAIIEAADKALYQAKRTGKNTVVTTESLIEEMA
ncbi:MAG: sensor domain-containing diguanylate cyclase [Candidatus Krumholzibacteria bacterium]|nr:sensor domain-containing diguanylate cyclase [Candidatus Krumholzibacteria bacterium]MDH4336458.1 sensor domain-containing diguanylate cyclase [Candidatus Krumholzibacteria bacterium]MDH5269050.1 sensor domain-containing diguanylate cyclase [Candidatus Krumholzibacteria bacterium]